MPEASPKTSQQPSDPKVDLDARYGRNQGRSMSTRVGLVFGGIVLAALAVWVVWMVWLSSNPKVTSTLNSWDVISPNSVSLEVTVNIRSDAQNVSCHVEIYAKDHSTVGEQDVVPKNGKQTLTMKTLSEATSVDWQGCTADGQNNTQ